MLTYLGVSKMSRNSQRCVMCKTSPQTFLSSGASQMSPQFWESKKKWESLSVTFSCAEWVRKGPGIQSKYGETWCPCPTMWAVSSSRANICAGVHISPVLILTGGNKKMRGRDGGRRKERGRRGGVWTLRCSDRKRDGEDEGEESESTDRGKYKDRYQKCQRPKN